MSIDKNSIVIERENKIIYKDGEKLVKLFKKKYPKSNVLNEALNHSRIEETDLLVPKLIEISNKEESWAITLEYIEGKNFKTLMEENPEKLDMYLEMFVDTQLKILSKQVPLLNRLKEKLKRKIEASELNDTIKYELYTRLESMPKHSKVCHGDFNPSNVLLDDRGNIHIIDWSHVSQGNASADVAQTYMLFCLENKMDIAEKYMKLFSKKSNIPVPNIQKWLPIVAASELSKYEGKEKEILLNWINVVEY